MQCWQMRDLSTSAKLRLGTTTDVQQEMSASQLDALLHGATIV